MPIVVWYNLLGVTSSQASQCMWQCVILKSMFIVQENGLCKFQSLFAFTIHRYINKQTQKRTHSRKILWLNRISGLFRKRQKRGPHLSRSSVKSFCLHVSKLSTWKQTHWHVHMSSALYMYVHGTNTTHLSYMRNRRSIKLIALFFFSRSSCNDCNN